MWSRKITSIEPIKNIDRIPLYGFLFFFQNLHPHGLWFLLFTSMSVCAAGLGFYSIYLLGDVISHIHSITWERACAFYLPLYALAIFCKEVFDYFIRKYGEAFPIVYGDHTRLRFYRTLLDLQSPQLMNLSKERLNALVSRYVANIQAFLNQWFWGTSRKLTSFLIVLTILYQQNVLVLAANLVYMLLFLGLAFKVSSRYSEIAKQHSLQSIESSEIVDSFLVHFNTVRRLNLRDFFVQTAQRQYGKNWDTLENVREFHAMRWFLQLNLFNVLYVGTLFYGIHQVTRGELELGFLVLIKYAYDQLWQFLVFVIDYYTSMIGQREVAKIIRSELKDIISNSRKLPFQSTSKPSWSEIRLHDVVTEFRDKKSSIVSRLSIPEFSLRRGERIAILGPSGSGKTTFLNILLNLFPYEGEYSIDGEDAQLHFHQLGIVSLISRYDPLFNLSLRDNITLGREIAEPEIQRALAGLQAQSFMQDLEQRVGDPLFHRSTGQEQRIRLARGLLRGADFYLLDEAMSGIDDDTRELVLDFLEDFLVGQTVVLVTHDLTDLRLAQRVYEIKDGVLRPTKIK